MRQETERGLHSRLHTWIHRHGWIVGAALAAALAVLLLLGQAARAEPQSQEAEAVARAWVEALNRGDTEGAIALYAEDASILALGKEITGKPAIAQRQRTTIGPTLKPSLTIESVAVQGDTATVRLLGENAITRFDRHGPVHNVTTFTVRDGKIVREVGPVLEPADAAWYATAAPRFQQSQAATSVLPRAGGQGGETGNPSALWLAGLAGVGAAFVSVGLVLKLRRPRGLSTLRRDEE